MMDSQDVRAHISEAARRLLSGDEAIAADVDGAIAAAVPELGADATIRAEMRASTLSNIRRWTEAAVLRPGEPVPGDVPPQAADLARSLVRRGHEGATLVQAYRAGQNTVLERWVAMLAELTPDAAVLAEALAVSGRSLNGYVDAVLDRLLEQMAAERETLRAGTAARRQETLRLVLDGAPVDEQLASARLGHDLRGTHVALVLWADPPGGEHGVLERAAELLARAAGAPRPLTFPAGTSALWAWCTVSAGPDAGVLRDAMAAAAGNVRVAVGPMRSGATGFRRSHAAALDVQRLVAGRPGAPVLTTHDEVEVAALVDADRAGEFVAGVLGPVAAAEAADLRATLLAWLDAGENAPAAAERLHVHRNTVLQRIARAEGLLGHPVAERRLAVHLALELAARLGLPYDAPAKRSTAAANRSAALR